MKNIHLEPEEWSVSNNMLSPSMKLKRFVTQEVYKETINALYCEGPIISCACLFTNRSLPQLQLLPVGVEDVPC